MKTFASATILTLLFMFPTLGAEPRNISPKDYLKLHIDAYNPSAPDWETAMAKLLESGDAFTIELIQKLKAHNQKSKPAATVTAVIDAARKRIQSETDAGFVKHIEPWLQAAALADVTCSPLEGVLVYWALKTVRQNIDRPGVRIELARIKKASDAKVDAEPMSALARKRAKLYVDQILKASSPDSAGGARLQ
jgi:hypothetical protein